MFSGGRWNNGEGGWHILGGGLTLVLAWLTASGEWCLLPGEEGNWAKLVYIEVEPQSVPNYQIHRLVNLQGKTQNRKLSFLWVNHMLILIESRSKMHQLWISQCSGYLWIIDFLVWSPKNPLLKLIKALFHRWQPIFRHVDSSLFFILESHIQFRTKEEYSGIDMGCITRIINQVTCVHKLNAWLTRVNV